MTPAPVKVFADHRERNSGIIDLLRKDCDLEEKQLTVGDFILGEGVCCERKEAKDFLSSLMDGRLFDQARNMKESYSKPFLLVEGIRNFEELYSLRNINRKAIRGALISLNLDYGIPTFFTKNHVDTADFLLHVAQREQNGSSREMRLRNDKRAFTLKEYQQLVVESFPGIGPKLAKELLKKFGSVKKFVSATEKRLQKVEKIGEKKAKAIRKVLEADFNEEEKEQEKLKLD